MTARPVSERGQLYKSHETAGSDIDLEIAIGNGRYTPWAIRFLSSGDFDIEFQATDGPGGAKHTDSGPAIAGELALCYPTRVLASTTSGLKFKAWY